MVLGVSKLALELEPIRGVGIRIPVTGSDISAGHDFIFGPENALVSVLSRYVQTHACQPLSSYRYHPIYIYGDPGTGKSHLTTGMANLWSRLCKRAHAELLSADQFARRATTNRTQSTAKKESRLTDASLLVIEDIDRLRRRQSPQARLAELIDDFSAAGKLLIITGDTSPMNNPSLLPRLASRLSSGLHFELLPPGPAVRGELLRSFLETHKLRLTPGCVEAATCGLSGTVLEVRQAIVRRYGQLQAGQLVESNLRSKAKKKLPSQDIDRICHRTLTAVARYCQIPLEQLIGKSRRRTTVQARGIAIYLLRSVADCSFKRIGTYLGGRDHSTVLHAYSKTVSLLRGDADLRRSVTEIRTLVE